MRLEIRGVRFTCTAPTRWPPLHMHMKENNDFGYATVDIKTSVQLLSCPQNITFYCWSSIKSLIWQVFMMLESNDNTLDMNFSVKHEGDCIWCMRPPAVYDVLNVETSDTTILPVCTREQVQRAWQAGSMVDASDNIEDLAEAIRDDVVPTVEVSAVNDDAVVSAENIESV